MLEELEKWFESEEGKESIERFINKTKNEELVLNNQLEKFHLKFKLEENFDKFIKLVNIKYSSDEYKNRWYNRSIEPPEDLFWFLFKYAKKYGRECDVSEWGNYGNMFSSSLFYINGYYFNRMDGQGSAIQVIKK